MVSLLAACAAGGARLDLQDAGLETPARWSGADSPDGQPLDRWWTTFSEPALDGIIDEALAGNRDLRAAAARVEAAAAEARIVGAELLPQVGVGVTGSRQKQNFIGFPDFTADLPQVPGAPAPEPRPEVLSTTSTRLGVSVDTSWEADLWGRLRAGKAAALADWQATRADFHAARLSLAGQTAKAWLAAVEAREQVDLSRRTASSYRTSAAQLRDRYERGVLPSLDLRLALNTLANAEATLAARQEQLDRGLRQLEILLGRYPAASLEVAPTLPPLPPQVPAGLPADLVGRRPDLVAAERRLAAAGGRLAASRRSLYPRLKLTASGGTTSEELGDLLDGDFSVWSLAAGLFQPLFQGGRLRAAVDRREALERLALASYASAALRAYAEVESALAAEQRLAAREDHLSESARQARAARALAHDRYLGGLEPYVTVLEAQRRELAAESLLLSARRLRLDNRVDLHLALGGGFTAGAGADETVAALSALEPPSDSRPVGAPREVRQP
jgi:NodT family efflux transporter outer membrane factor (OMF) lipoprotein